MADFPVALNGSLAPFISRSKLREHCEQVYEMLGGVQRLYQEANQDSESYRWFMGLYVKVQPKELDVSTLAAQAGIETYIKRIEERERSIETTYVEVEYAVEEGHE